MQSRIRHWIRPWRNCSIGRSRSVFFVKRGELWWANLPGPKGSGPGFRRPVLVVSSNSLNDSRIGTVIVAVITSTVRLATAPGNVSLSSRGTGLSKPSVANVSQLLTVDRAFLAARIGRVTSRQLTDVDEGLRLALDL